MSTAIATSTSRRASGRSSPETRGSTHDDALLLLGRHFGDGVQHPLMPAALEVHPQAVLLKLADDGLGAHRRAGDVMDDAPDDQTGKLGHAVVVALADHPVDAIWRAVLAQDDDAMAATDLGAGPVRLLVERRATGVEVTRLEEPAWRFAAALCASRPLQTAIEAAPEVDAATLLAEHLAAGRFIGFELVDSPITSGLHS